MSKYCRKCGKLIEQSSTQCPFCGYISTAQKPIQRQSVQQQYTPVSTAQNPQQFVPQQQQYQPKQPQYQPQHQQPVKPVTPVKPTKQKKAKKQHKLPGIVRFFITIITIAGVLLGGWYAFGNMITLYIHSEDVVDTLNSGSLELEGTQSAYDELPDYVKKMLGKNYAKEDFGPVTKAVLPHITVKRVKINGFFNNSTIKYEITAPDLEKWLLNLKPNSFANEKEMLALMTKYIKKAPRRTAEVEIQYERDGFFSIDWRGNYYTREFTDAVCGGFNSAYNVIYEQAMNEIEEAFKNAGKSVEKSGKALEVTE